jgi:predicted nuclease of predicted toxin-antitoxin system
MRFYLDEELSDRIAVIARGLGLDVISSHECGRDGSDDETQLLQSARDGRCFVTRNRADFVALSVRFFERDYPHAGVLLLAGSLPGDDFAGIANALAAYGQRHPDGQSAYVVDFLQTPRR